MKIRNILLIILVVFVELAIMGPFFSTYFLSILTAAALFMVLKSNIEEALLSVFLIGFAIDVSSFNRLPMTTIIVLLELGVVYFAKRKLVDFRNPISIFLFVVGFSLLRFVIFASVYHGFTSEISTIYSILANIIMSFLFAIAIFKLTMIRKIDTAQ